MPLASQPTQVPVTGKAVAEPRPVATPVLAAQLLVWFAVIATPSIPTSSASLLADEAPWPTAVVPGLQYSVFFIARDIGLSSWRPRPI